MGKISIKLDIVGVIIPMTIWAEDEEELRLLAKKINEKASEIRQMYPVQDTATLLAMVTLQIAIDARDKPNILSNNYLQDLSELKTWLDTLAEESGSLVKGRK